MSLDRVRTERISGTHDRNGFDCGEPSLNDFLQRYARQNDSKGLGRTFVAVEGDSPTVLGYYTLSGGSVTFEIVPDTLPRYPVPVAHLGRLAVSQAAQGRRLGELLLLDALRRTANVATQMGLYAVEVYALTEQPRAFYLRYDFAPLQDDPLHLYLTIKKVRKLFG